MRLGRHHIHHIFMLKPSVKTSLSHPDPEGKSISRFSTATPFHRPAQGCQATLGHFENKIQPQRGSIFSLGLQTMSALLIFSAVAYGQSEPAADPETTEQAPIQAVADSAPVEPAAAAPAAATTVTTEVTETVVVAPTPEELAAESQRQMASEIDGSLPEFPEPPESLGIELADGPPPGSGANQPPSETAVVNLIRMLVERDILSADDAALLERRAEEEAEFARRNAEALAFTNDRIVELYEAEQEVPYFTDDDMRVTYIPDTVRAQIRDELRADIMAQALAEGWASPRSMPEWTQTIRLFGDVRVRSSSTFFPDGNDITGAFPNFNAINTGAPFDVAGFVFSPQYNVDQDRQAFQLRVRLGLEAQLGEGFTAGLQFATGSSNSPVSTNQSFGQANQGQGGNFSKYDLWLDRGFLRYDFQPDERSNVSIFGGRFDNPFFSSDVIWDNDIGMDGIALKASYEVVEGVTPFVTAGAFPIFNTDFNFATNQPEKFSSDDKYLYAIQGGVDLKYENDITSRLGVAYYNFSGVEGELSDPFVPLTASDRGPTDNRRPSFAQKGNTYMPLRDIPAVPANNFGTINQFQYFGLATPFEVLTLTGRVDFHHFEPFTISIFGEYLTNLALDDEAVNAVAVNNRGAIGPEGGFGDYDGGGNAWILGLEVGQPKLAKRGDWRVGVNYRYVETDAVVDGFADSDFGLGGTNVKGFTLYGGVAITPNVSFNVRWLSADPVTGPPFKVDVLQVDVSGKF